MVAQGGGHEARVVICTDHTRITLLELDGQELQRQSSAPAVSIKTAGSSVMTLQAIVGYAQSTAV